MSTVEDLETQIDYIVNRYEDIDKEREEKINKNKKWIENVSTYAPFIVTLILGTFIIGLGCGVYLFR